MAVSARITQQVAFGGRMLSASDVTKVEQMPKSRTVFHQGGRQLDPPTHWDCRTEHGSMLTPITHQAQGIGSAAVVAVAALADRWAIWNNQSTAMLLSAAYVDVPPDATLAQAWLFLQMRGTRAQDMEDNNNKKGEGGGEENDESGVRARQVYYVHGSERNIRAEIYVHGPVTTAFPLTQHFLDYWQKLSRSDSSTNTVYHWEPNHVELGVHAVRIVGWGTSPEANDYWIVANSWGFITGAHPFDYGTNGYFLVARGDGSPLEQNVVTGAPFLSGKDLQPECCEFKDVHVSDIGATLLSANSLHVLGTPLSPDLQPLELCKLKRQKHRRNKHKKNKKSTTQEVVKITHDSSKSATTSKDPMDKVKKWFRGERGTVDGPGVVLLCVCGTLGVILVILVFVVLNPHKKNNGQQGKHQRKRKQLTTPKPCPDTQTTTHRTHIPHSTS